MSFGQTTKLNTGAAIPMVGLGTAEASSSVFKLAIDTGYRHIDTAWAYKNEKEVGDAIRHSSIPREQIFLTTKLWNNSHRPEDVLPALDLSLKNLGLDYVDLYLMHWPIAFKSGPTANPADENGIIIHQDTDFTVTWEAMEALVATGKVRAIGVSNFTINHLEKLLKVASIIPAVNQVELHPQFPQWELLEYCRPKGIHLTAYAPLGSPYSRLVEDESISKIAQKHSCTNASVLISWARQRGTSVIPKSSSESRIISNFEDVELDESDMDAISAIGEKLGYRRYYDTLQTLPWGIDAFADSS